MRTFKPRGTTQAYTSAGLAASGAATTHQWARDVHYSIGGIAYYKAAASGIATPTTDSNTGAAMTLTGTATTGQAALLVWCLDSSAATKVVMGSKVATDVSGNLLAPLTFPDIPDALCPIAYTVLKHYAQASTVTVGSSNWNTAGFAQTHYNVCGMPERPPQS